MFKKIMLLTTIVILLLVLSVTSVVATTPDRVQIEVTTSYGNPSPFVATGPAAYDGLICGSGIVVEDFGQATGFSQNGFNFQGVKHFICADGSGEFFVNLQARIDYRKGTTFNWNVLNGTGDYEDLHGAGSGIGLYNCGPECVLDIYDGQIHID